mmetsp:Transcript_41662/g.116047  ORF Transcript_41662/g.116047 Transcript_41662/m.116047 type:complete len:390 (-) Transcript_41662:1126-2295(-)
MWPQGGCSALGVPAHGRKHQPRQCAESGRVRHGQRLGRQTGQQAVRGSLAPRSRQLCRGPAGGWRCRRRPCRQQVLHHPAAACPQGRPRLIQEGVHHLLQEIQGAGGQGTGTEVHEAASQGHVVERHCELAALRLPASGNCWRKHAGSAAGTSTPACRCRWSRCRGRHRGRCQAHDVKRKAQELVCNRRASRRSTAKAAAAPAAWQQFRCREDVAAELVCAILPLEGRVKCRDSQRHRLWHAIEGLKGVKAAQKGHQGSHCLREQAWPKLGVRGAADDVHTCPQGVLHISRCPALKQPEDQSVGLPQGGCDLPCEGRESWPRGARCQRPATASAASVPLQRDRPRPHSRGLQQCTQRTEPRGSDLRCGVLFADGEKHGQWNPTATACTP